jgi:hypothetical protein
MSLRINLCKEGNVRAVDCSTVSGKYLDLGDWKRMKFVSSTISILALALLLSAAAFAKDKDSGSFDLQQRTKVGSTELQPGHYKANWKPVSGTNVEVNILAHGKTVATTQGQIKELPKTSTQDAVIIDSPSNGERQAVEIDFRGLNHALVFGS